MIDFASMNKTVYKFCFATLACNWKTKTNLWRKKERKKEALIIQFKVMEIDEKLLTTHP